MAGRSSPVCGNIYCGGIGLETSSGERKLVLGSVSVIGLSRNTGAVKLSDPVGQVRPFPQLGLKRCRAVIAHEGQNVRSGHWFSFVFSCESWWRVDTLRGTPTREDPFCNQLNIGSHGYTLDLFFFW